MSITEWIENNFGAEARLKRLERQVEKKVLEAEYAEREIPLLEQKEKAIEILNKKKKLVNNIRQKQFQNLNKNKLKSPSLKINLPKSEFKPKTAEDRVYGK